MKITAWLVAAVAIVVALVAPTAAGPASRIYLLLLAGVAALWGSRKLLMPPPYPTVSRLGATVAEPISQALPEEYRRMAALMSRYRDSSKPVAIDPIARHLLRSIASQRLYHRYQLRLDVLDHLGRIQPLVSPMLWAAISPPPRSFVGAPLPYPDVLSTAIPSLIDELERL